MSKWEEIIKTLPTDKILEKREKNGKNKEIDNKISLLEQEIEKIKRKNAKEDEELERMLKELNISDSPNQKTK